MNRDEAFEAMQRMIAAANNNPNARVTVIVKRGADDCCEMVSWSDTPTTAQFVSALAAGQIITHAPECECDSARFLNGVLALFKQMAGTIHSIHDEPAGRA